MSKEKNNEDSDIEVIFNNFDIGSNEFTLLIPKQYRKSIVFDCLPEQSNSILSKLPSILQGSVIVVDTVRKVDGISIVFCDKEIISKIYISLLIHMPKLRIKECIFTNSNKFMATNCLDENNFSFEYADTGPNNENDYPHSFILSNLDDEEIEEMRNEFDENKDYIRIVSPHNENDDSDDDTELRYFK